MNIKNLPKNVLFSILLKCDIKSCLNLSCIIHKINQIWNNDYFWKCKYIHDFPKHRQYTFELYKESYIHNYLNEYYYLEIDSIDVHSPITFKDYLKNAESIDVSKYKSTYDYVGDMYQWKNHYLILLYDTYGTALLSVNKFDKKSKIIITSKFLPYIIINNNYIFLIDIIPGTISYIDENLIKVGQCEISVLHFPDSNKLIDLMKIYDDIEMPYSYLINDTLIRYLDNFSTIVSNKNIIYTQHLKIDIFNKLITWIS